MISTRRLQRFLAITLLAAFGTAACSDDEGQDGGSDGFFTASLEQVPDSARNEEGHVLVYAADYDAATELAGASRPADGTTDEDSATNGVLGVTDVLEQGVSFRTARPWNEVLSDPEVSADGRFVTATFELTDITPNSFWNILDTRDSLVTSSS